ncbi:MAG: ATP-binding protein, partial [Myxococcales bacterium]
IPQGEQRRIFDRFAQASSPRERRGGTGLGLPIALEAARVHDGNLTVRSGVQAARDAPPDVTTAPGVASVPEESGTTFILTLPRVHLPKGVMPATWVHSGPESADALPRGGPRTEVAQAIWAGPSPDSPLVVVIEDDDDLRTYIAETLSRKYRVRTAADGEEGLELIRVWRPDAVVCDVAMPRKDGYRVCQEIRADRNLKMIPILLLTARRHVDRIVEGFDAGASDYLMKPFHVQELLARLEAHLLVRYLLRATAHKERLASLGLLAAGVAHQVRNPLSALKNTVRAIERKVNAPGDANSPRVAPEMFALVGECVTRIETFTRDLLDLSRVDSEQVGVFAPQTGLESVLRLMATRVSAHVRLTCSVEPGLQMTGRAADLNHVFMNLIDNALHAVGTRGAIEIRAGREQKDFIFEIGDSGPGIPPEKSDWVFEPFATTRSTEGTGLGLFLVKKIVFENGGRISVDRSPLGGALFRVRIPAHISTGIPQSVLSAGRTSLLERPAG